MMWECGGGKDELCLKSSQKKKQLSCKEKGRKTAGIKSKKQIVLWNAKSSIQSVWSIFEGAEENNIGEID